MDIQLLYLGVGVTGFNPNRPLGSDLEGSWIAHGIASIGASLKAAGYGVGLTDLRRLSSWEDLIKRLPDMKADVFGLSISPVDSAYGVPISQMIKHFHPGSRVIVGGIHPTLFPHEYDVPTIDTVITGEGEVTFVNLVRDLEQNKPWPRVVKGIKPDLDALPWVDRELFQYYREVNCRFAPDQKLPSITMLAGRGCAFKCTYCQPAENSVFGSPFRIRSPQNVIDELISLKKKYQYRSITFWDDTFTFSRKWAMEFADLYEQSGIGASIAACSRADIICKNETMIERLASIGVDWLVIGFESGSQRILNLIKKGVTVEQNIRAGEICRKYGIKIFGTYMYGLPTETREEAAATARMIEKINPEHPSPFIFLPIKGTDIHTYCQENDLIAAEPGTIARTGMFTRSLKGIDYDYLGELMCKKAA